jgi:hypothetical protein
MKITTRDLLAELLVEALDAPITAMALHCLAKYSGAATPLSPAISVKQLLEPITALHYDSVLAKLQTTPLLAGDFSKSFGQVTLADALASEWREISDKFIRFGAALQAWSPDAKDTPVQQALKKGVLLFNHHLFFEVHEVLEAQWMLETGEEKRFLQGLIQIAVAFYHLENQNVRGALSLLHDGIEKLVPYQPIFLDVDLPPFIIAIKKLRDHLQHLAAEDIAQVRALTIPRIDFTNRS